MLRFLAALSKIALASLLTGVALSLFNISSEQILQQAGLTPEMVWTYLLRLTGWALPNILLGSMIIVPVWLLVFLYRPPGTRSE